jgi:hypothetical protein
VHAVSKEPFFFSGKLPGKTSPVIFILNGALQCRFSATAAFAVERILCLRSTRPFLIICCALPATLRLAQTQQSDIVSVGYYRLAPLRVSPGQVITLFVHGLSVTESAADRAPLPISLEGVSVSIDSSNPGLTGALPIFRASPYELGCALRPGFQCEGAAITVQIPTEASCTPSIIDPSCTSYCCGL